jgi:hypothetical protein
MICQQTSTITSTESVGQGVLEILVSPPLSSTVVTVVLSVISLIYSRRPTKKFPPSSRTLLVRVQASVVVDVVEGDQVAEAVEVEPIVISESSVEAAVVNPHTVVDLEDLQLLLMVEDSVDHLLQRHTVELLPHTVVAVVDMVVDLTETHQGAAAAANPGGKLPFDDVSSDNYSIRLIDLG